MFWAIIVLPSARRRDEDDVASVVEEVESDGRLDKRPIDLLRQRLLLTDPLDSTPFASRRDRAERARLWTKRATDIAAGGWPRGRRVRSDRVGVRALSAAKAKAARAGIGRDGARAADTLFRHDVSECAGMDAQLDVFGRCFMVNLRDKALETTDLTAWPLASTVASFASERAGSDER
jgi:hypothetical protein